MLRTERNKRQHLSSVLARNEVARDYAYNRQARVDQGWYQFNPQLLVRRRVAKYSQLHSNILHLKVCDGLLQQNL